MKKFFKPAIKFVNRFTYPQKIIIICALFVLPLVATFYQMNILINREIDLARNEGREWNTAFASVFSWTTCSSAT